MYEVNIWAVLVAAASSFLLGGLWYSPALFGRLWNRQAGRVSTQDGHPVRGFGISFLLAMLAAYQCAALVGPHPPLGRALHYGIFVGGGFVAACFGIHYQFANRSLLLWAIDGGYHVVQFLLFALVLAFWP